MERAGDNLGTLVGPPLAAALVAWLGIRETLLLAAMPGVFAAVAITIAALGLAAGPRTWPLLLVAFALAGTGIGLAQTAESTLVARALPDRLRGSGFELLGVVQAGGDFVSSAMVRLLWATVSPTLGFGYAAAWMAASLTAAVALGRVGRR